VSDFSAITYPRYWYSKRLSRYYIAASAEHEKAYLLDRDQWIAPPAYTHLRYPLLCKNLLTQEERIVRNREERDRFCNDDAWIDKEEVTIGSQPPL
jgi:hypothetical protein